VHAIECLTGLATEQVASTLKMQAVAPRIKQLQAKYPNDQEKIQLETARVYRESGVNPLAGCLPTLATIPVFIGLYRCVRLFTCIACSLATDHAGSSATDHDLFLHTRKKHLQGS
jgi:YidC/Oxa1 family membrane protein insertase